MKTPVILFEEVQRSGRMKHRWFYGTIAIIFGLALIFNHFYSKENATFTGFLWGGLVVFFFLQVFSSLSFALVTQIRDDGIYVRFPPYQSSFKKFAWEDIQEIHVKKFDPLTEYGFGVKLGPSGRGYTLPGDTGIYIVLKDQLPVMISTKCPGEVIEVLKKIGRIK